MTKPITSVPYTFATATTTLPLSYLDSDFTTVLNFLNDLTNYSNYVADSGSANAIVLNYPVGTNTTTMYRVFDPGSIPGSWAAFSRPWPGSESPSQEP